MLNIWCLIQVYIKSTLVIKGTANGSYSNLGIPTELVIRNLAPSNGSDLARGLLGQIVIHLEARTLPVAVQPKLNRLWYMQFSCQR